MRITCNAQKRAKTLTERGLDFRRATDVFAGRTLTYPDRRKDCGERRLVTAGYLDERLVIVVWTPRGIARRVISMRKANETEVENFEKEIEAIESPLD